MDYLTVTQAARLLNMTPRRVQQLIHDQATPFPGARQVDPEMQTSAYIIPRKEVQTYQKKRAQSSGEED